MSFYTPKEDAAGLTQAQSFNDDLPHVLLIGDSISIGYTALVRDLLRERCNVHRPDANCGDTKNALLHIDTWLGERHWDLIHFNWGLHDLCYRNPAATVYGNRDKVHGTLSVTPEAYKENLKQLVLKMRAQSQRLIWASTTFIPEGEAGRKQGDDKIYNNIAKEIMAEHEIPCNDLYKITQDFSEELFTCPADGHFSPAGNCLLAQAVADCIKAVLIS